LRLALGEAIPDVAKLRWGHQERAMQGTDYTRPPAPTVTTWHDAHAA
jgi:hypothetical protein